MEEAQTLTLTLSGKQLDTIANALGQRPYIEVAQLLQEIAQQLKAQTAKPPQE